MGRQHFWEEGDLGSSETDGKILNGNTTNRNGQRPNHTENFRSYPNGYFHDPIVRNGPRSQFAMLLSLALSLSLFNLTALSTISRNEQDCEQFILVSLVLCSASVPLALYTHSRIPVPDGSVYMFTCISPLLVPLTSFGCWTSIVHKLPEQESRTKTPPCHWLVAVYVGLAPPTDCT